MGPGSSFCMVYQLEVCEVVDACEGMRLPKGRTANRKHRFRAQAYAMKVRPVAVAVTDGKIYLVVNEIDVLRVGGNSKIDVLIDGRKFSKPRDKPFRGKTRRDADSQDACPANRVRERRVTCAQPLQSFGREGQISLSGIRQRKRFSVSREQLLVEPLFQLTDGVADSALRDVQLFRGSGEALVPRSRFEGPHSADRRRNPWLQRHAFS